MPYFIEYVLKKDLQNLSEFDSSNSSDTGPVSIMLETFYTIVRKNGTTEAKVDRQVIVRVTHMSMIFYDYWSPKCLMKGQNNAQKT